jgi:hypothetical protein
MSAFCPSTAKYSLIVALALPLLSGCGGKPSPASGGAKGEAAVKSDTSAKPDDAAKVDEPARPKFAPIKLGSSDDSANSKKAAVVDGYGNVLEAMQPLQIVLGKWRGVTLKKFEGMSKVEEPEWVWDFLTSPKQPALVVTSDASHYLKTGRMTFLIDKQEFQFTATDKDGTERVYQGTFTKPVEDVPGDDKKLQRTFTLTLKQISPADDRKFAQVAFSQKENNRYFLEIYDKRGDGVLKIDTVANQREGTSFALNPDDYGEKKCVVSGGLGTSTVSYKGKTYYVCCSGCEAAFKDDPERWIKKFEESNKK